VILAGIVAVAEIFGMSEAGNAPGQEVGGSGSHWLRRPIRSPPRVPTGSTDLTVWGPAARPCLHARPCESAPAPSDPGPVVPVPLQRLSSKSIPSAEPD
jgi:hypothetical protein